MVSVLVPRAALVPVVTVRVEAPDVVIELGLKLAWVLLGKPETLRLTLPVKPLSGATVTV
jgi:hypothetical protein